MLWKYEHQQLADDRLFQASVPYNGFKALQMNFNPRFLQGLEGCFFNPLYNNYYFIFLESLN